MVVMYRNLKLESELSRRLAELSVLIYLLDNCITFFGMRPWHALGVVIVFTAIRSIPEGRYKHIQGVLMTAEHAHGTEFEPQPLATFDLAGHIADRALNEPTYSIDYIHPDLVSPTAEALMKDERLDIQTPFVYARGSNLGHFTLKVSAAQAPLAEVIPFPSQY